MKGRQCSYDLLTGDYLQVTSPRGSFRPAVHGSGVDEGFTRIERIEHLPKDLAQRVFSHQGLVLGPVPVVWCHGVPGPLVLGGDVQVLDRTSPDRVRNDTAHPWWPPAEEVLLRGGLLAGDTPYRERRQPDSEIRHIDWAHPASSPRSPHRATGFSKPASALRVGDYLRIHDGRWPETDQDVDEGFARVEHLRLLDQEPVETLFADPAWHTTLVVASVHGLLGVVVLRAEDEVTVMAFPNPDREILERRYRWSGRPDMEFTGSRLPTDAERQAADSLDAALRPRVNEADWYRSLFPNSFARRLTAEGVDGMRTVPLSALPWPHSQSSCLMYRIVDAHRHTVPDEQAAHAAAFLSPEGQQVMASCQYHQTDWPRLARILQESLDQTDDTPKLAEHPEYHRLSHEEKEGLHSLAEVPIDWSDRDQRLTNGQHRLCALRAAGVLQCPVRGYFLLDTDYGSPISAADHARAAIKASWRNHALKQGWPAWAGTLASALPRAIRTRLIARTSR